MYVVYSKRTEKRYSLREAALAEAHEGKTNADVLDQKEDKTKLLKCDKC